MARFEVFILNYNGAQHLTTALRSLEQVERDYHQLGINLIDNNSTDNSLDLVESDFSSVNIIPLAKNFGFAAGNNRGVRQRLRELKSQRTYVDFLVFLNNDTKVEKDWLIGAYTAFQENQSAGIIGSKSLFFDRFAKIRIECSSSYQPSIDGLPDPRELGIFLHSPVHGENIRPESQRLKIEGCYPLETSGRWIKRNSNLFVPIEDAQKRASTVLSFSNIRPDKSNIELKLYLEPSVELVCELSVPAGKTAHAHVNFEAKDYVDVIQNAGSYITQNWESGDRGFLQIENGQFDKTEEVDSICGVSMFIKRDLFEELGGFDEQFFAYYEDTELSLRAKMLGQKCVYAPASKLRHVHCGSGVEHSDYFNTNVTWSQLVFWSKVLPAAEWNEKLEHYKTEARNQFSLFLDDLNLDKKPHLRSYCRYLKHRIAFYKNRLFSDEFATRSR